MTDLINPKTVAAIREDQRRWRKYGAGVTVNNAVIKDAAGDAGVVVQTVHSNSGVLLSTETYQLADVEANGLPLPNLANQGNRHGTR